MQEVRGHGDTGETSQAALRFARTVEEGLRNFRIASSYGSSHRNIPHRLILWVVPSEYSAPPTGGWVL
eukprot:18100-Prorocentrum_minimum.AAC.1